jgi:hypothetical protein
MTKASKDTGVILALVERFTKYRLPRVNALKEKVEKGECLSQHDIAYLDKVFKEANRNMPLVDSHPEWQALAGRAINLYKEITTRALENEKEF